MPKRIGTALVSRHPDLIRLLDAAFGAHKSRRPHDVERLCQEILRFQPDHPEALNLLGVALQDEGRAANSIPLLLRATRLDPKFSDAFANLARGFRLTNEDDKAVIAARTATELDPALDEGWLQLGFSLAALGREEEALPVLREAVGRIPGNVDLRTCLGATAQAAEDNQTAAEAWRSVLRLRPERIDATINLGIVLARLNQLDEATALLRQASERVPDDIAALEALAFVLHKKFDGPELISVCRRILALQPDRLDVMTTLGNGLLWLGQFDEVEKICAAVLAADPSNHAFARQFRATIPSVMDQSEMALCREQLADDGLPPDVRINVGHALAKSLDHVGDHDGAFGAHLATKALLHAADQTARRGFRLTDLQEFIANTRAQYTPSLFGALRPFGNPSDLPVFIVGMPRSGTSLVEQIAASHPADIRRGGTVRHDGHRRSP